MKKIFVLSFVLTLIIIFSGCSLIKVDDNKEAPITKDIPADNKEISITKNILAETANNQDNIQPIILKSYTNNKINITLEYPKDVLLSEPGPDVAVFNLMNKREYLQIQVLDYAPPSPADNYMPNSASFIGDVVIGSTKANKYFTNNPLGEGVLEGGYPFTNYVIKINNKKYIQIGYYGAGESQEIFENIIKSIKFN